MSIPVLYRSFPPPPVSKKDVLRYAGGGTLSEETNALLEACLQEAEPHFSYQVAFCKLPYRENDGHCDFGVFSFVSRDLAKALSGCSKVLLFAATVGVGIDRLIGRYSRLSPAKANFFAAIGTERAEALCDAFCQWMEREDGIRLRPRFSPGYGDLPLSVQRQIFDFINPNRIGLCLTDSLLMTPTKSVTAFAGIYP